MVTLPLLRARSTLRLPPAMRPQLTSLLLILTELLARALSRPTRCRNADPLELEGFRTMAIALGTMARLTFPSIRSGLNVPRIRMVPIVGTMELLVVPCMIGVISATLPAATTVSLFHVPNLINAARPSPLMLLPGLLLAPFGNGVRPFPAFIGWVLKFPLKRVLRWDRIITRTEATSRH